MPHNHAKSSSNTSKSKSSSRTSRNKKRLRRVTTPETDSDKENNANVDANEIEIDNHTDTDEVSDSDEDIGGHSITHDLKRRKRRRVKGSGNISGLPAFKNAARWLAASHSPNIPWLNVLAAGLERDQIIKKGSMGIVTDDKKEWEDLVMAYDLLCKLVPSFEKDIKTVIRNGSMDALIGEMNDSTSDAVSQDIRSIKDTLIQWLPDVLGRDPIPPIPPNDKKSDTRGWNHLDICRLLCTPIKLPQFDKDPEKFQQLVRENELEDGPITAGHFPSVVYGDLGDKASTAPDKVFEMLLNGWLLLLTWVHVFLGKTNANTFRDHDYEKSATFKFRKTGKAWTHRLSTVMPRTIAYAYYILRHTLSSSDDRRIEEDGVIKQDAFDAVVALFEDKEYMYEPWIEPVLAFWQNAMGFMLPSDAKPELCDKEDVHSSLNQIAQLVKSYESSTDPEPTDTSSPTNTPPATDSTESNPLTSPSTDFDQGIMDNSSVLSDVPDADVDASTPDILNLKSSSPLSSIVTASVATSVAQPPVPIASTSKIKLPKSNKLSALCNIKSHKIKRA
ncbi:hypothetical protein FB446DRAFT_706601 [Lentinula raphanica]|nr:hypothetical protein FB446DRAFT_706601 [Lentinula raphanica]